MARKDLFEGSQVKLTGTAKRGWNSSVTFHLDFSTTVDGKNSLEIEKTSHARLNKTISHQYELPDVPDDREIYILTWGAEAKGVKGVKLSPDVIRVWPRSMTLKAVDDKGEKAEGFPFRFRQGLQSVEARATDAEGMSSFDLTDPEPVRQITPIAPWELMGEAKQNGRKWEATVRKKPYTATFYSPDFKDEWKDDDGQVKQYVNLSGADGNLGNTIKIKIGPKAKDGKKDQNLGMQGDSFYIQFIYDDKNSKRDDPIPKLTTPGGLAKEGNTYKSKVELSNDGELVEFEIDVGLAGGDKFEVKIGVTEECEDESIKIVNWRKIHYHVTRPDTLAVPSMAHAEKCFKDVFIEFESYEVDGAMIKEDTVGVPAGAWVDGSVIAKDAPDKVLVVGTHNVGFFKGKFDKKKTPAAHVILCHYQLDAKNCEFSTGNITIDDTDKVKWPLGSNTEVRGWSMPGSQTGKGSARFFDKDLRDGTDAVKQSQWRQNGGAWQAIPRDHIAIDQANHGNYVHFKIPDAAATAIDDGDSVEIRMKVSYALGWYNGWCTNGDRHNVIKAGRPDKGINGTIVHETGHAIYQTAKDATQFPGLDAPPHDRYYTNNRGHSGSHCADGIDKVTYDDNTKKMNTAHASSKCTCVMYGAGSDKRNENLAFCDKCKPYVCAVKIEEVTT